MDARAQAIEELYRERFAGYCNALATVTGSYESARDSVQEAFVQALRKRRRLRREDSLAPWVWTIAYRLALDSRRRGGSVQRDSNEPALPVPERDAELAAAIKSLPPRRRLVVFLRYFADFSYAEIADACQVSEGTVAATLAQAHEALRSALEAGRAEGARRCLRWLTSTLSSRSGSPRSPSRTVATGATFAAARGGRVPDEQRSS